MHASWEPQTSYCTLSYLLVKWTRWMRRDTLRGRPNRLQLFASWTLLCLSELQWKPGWAKMLWALKRKRALCIWYISGPFDTRTSNQLSNRSGAVRSSGFPSVSTPRGWLTLSIATGEESVRVYELIVIDAPPSPRMILILCDFSNRPQIQRVRNRGAYANANRCPNPPQYLRLPLVWKARTLLVCPKNHLKEEDKPRRFRQTSLALSVGWKECHCYEAVVSICRCCQSLRLRCVLRYQGICHNCLYPTGNSPSTTSSFRSGIFITTVAPPPPTIVATSQQVDQVAPDTSSIPTSSMSK